MEGDSSFHACSSGGYPGHPAAARRLEAPAIVGKHGRDANMGEQAHETGMDCQSLPPSRCSQQTHMAATRYDISNMACSEVQALVKREGEAVLAYRSSSILGLPIYDRYVKDRQYCASSEVIRRAGVPTTDKKYCPVKQVCRQPDLCRPIGGSADHSTICPMGNAYQNRKDPAEAGSSCGDEVPPGGCRGGQAAPGLDQEW